MCFLFSFIVIIVSYLYGMEWVFRTGTPICNTALMGNMGSTYNGSLCDDRLEINQV
jgi:hypothetical protein